MRRAARTAFLACALAACAPAEPPAAPAPPDPPCIASLAALSIDALRERRYGSTIVIEESLDALPFHSYLASYESDGLRLYTRIDVPGTPAPASGHPVVVFLHGWRGIDAAPSLDFYYAPDSYYHDMVEAYRDAGFAVLVPGLRGHGTVDGVPAEGIEYLAAWDNGSYLSPVFYAIDVLNLLDSLTTFTRAPLDLGQVNLVGHSQGGDVALLALAVAGDGSALNTRVNAASIWAGTFAERFVQLRTYEPMQKSREAFLSGDGTWTGTARGADGAINPHFVFGWPADWIATLDPDAWTWQNETWSMSVPEAISLKLDEMYDAINTCVADIDDAGYLIDVEDGRPARVTHDRRVAGAMAKIDAFVRPALLREPLALQHSDRDFYSPPAWNADLCERINRAGGTCHDFDYFGNTHSLRLSEHEWFSPGRAREGFDEAVRRDVRLFRGADPGAP